MVSMSRVYIHSDILSQKNWILSGGDIVRLKTIMGHSNIAVTNEYLAMFGQDLQMDFEKFNPLDNLEEQKQRTNQNVKENNVYEEMD